MEEEAWQGGCCSEKHDLQNEHGRMKYSILVDRIIRLVATN